MSSTYQIDTQIQLTGTFWNVEAEVVADPSSISVFVEDPSGIVTEYAYPGAVAKQAIGVYTFLFVPAGPGCWKYQWQGEGTVIATSPVKNFFVRASDLIE